jgi:hypothetical protein
MSLAEKSWQNKWGVIVFTASQHDKVAECVPQLMRLLQEQGTSSQLRSSGVDSSNETSLGAAEPVVEETPHTQKWLNEVLTLLRSPSSRLRIAGATLLQGTAQAFQFGALKSQINVTLSALLAIFKALYSLCVVCQSLRLLCRPCIGSRRCCGCKHQRCRTAGRMLGTTHTAIPLAVLLHAPPLCIVRRGR